MQLATEARILGQIYFFLNALASHCSVKKMKPLDIRPIHTDGELDFFF